jgi:hypothetical protein
LKVAKKGDLEITLAADLDLAPGDRIGIAPTSYDLKAAEEATVASYDLSSGVCKVKEALKYYHYGAAASTGGKFGGVDMRGEVVLLTRNLKIVGAEDVLEAGEAPWGAQVLTAGITTFEGKQREGQVILDNIEIYHASQIGTEKAALRFETAVAKPQTITNCAMHKGLGPGILMMNAANVKVENNVIFDFRQLGASFDGITTLTFKNNFVGKIGHFIDAKFKEGESKMAGVAICSYKWTKCSGINVEDNIVAGATYAGFTVPGHDCGAKNPVVFKNNVAHSCGNSLNGNGAFIYPAVGNEAHTKTCYEGSHFAAYKCIDQAVYAYYKVKKVVFKHITSVDNAIGIGASIANSNEYNGLEAEITDSTIYGDFPESSDCPEDKSFCKKLDKIGVIQSNANNDGALPVHLEAPCLPVQLPVWLSATTSAWSFRAIYRRLKFIGFPATTA